MKKKTQQSSCDSCLYYEYDEEYECYVCQMDLDEDEMKVLIKSLYNLNAFFTDENEEV